MSRPRSRRRLFDYRRFNRATDRREQRSRLVYESLEELVPLATYMLIY